jgi:hypothetical protein
MDVAQGPDVAHPLHIRRTYIPSLDIDTSLNTKFNQPENYDDRDAQTEQVEG